MDKIEIKKIVRNKYGSIACTGGNPDDPILKSILAETKISENELRESEGAIVSAEIFAQKPALTF